jgi:hypothetical protein
LAGSAAGLQAISPRADIEHRRERARFDLDRNPSDSAARKTVMPTVKHWRIETVPSAFRA